MKNFFKISIQRITIAIIFFVTGVFSTILVIENWAITKELAPSFATLIAAFCGAWFAYQLQIRSKEKQKITEIISLANQVLFSLFQRANSLKLIQIDFIDPLRSNPGKHIAMQPLLNTDGDVISFDISKLNFLLGTNYHQLIFDLYIEDRRYETAIKIIDHRSNLHLNEAQPRMQSAGLLEGEDHTEEDYKAALGPMIYPHLKRATDDLIYHVDRTVESTVAVKEKLLQALKEMYPKERFFNFELL